jgi:NTP pyrophosphatase (non-canonical NTP hydrolase)
MDNKTYQERALLTESKPTELNFGEVGLHIVLNAAGHMTEMMDRVKKTAFYGKALNKEEFRALAESLAGYAQLMFQVSDQLEQKHDKALYQALPEECRNIKAENLDLRKLHCAIGVFTEAGELLAAVRKQLEGQPIDDVNFAEEIGDVQWYAAVGADSCDTSLEHIQVTNIAKLAARYPEKFTPEAALERNLAKERAILEGKAE